MNLKFKGNQVTYFFKLNQQYFFTVWIFFKEMNYFIFSKGALNVTDFT